MQTDLFFRDNPNFSELIQSLHKKIELNKSILTTKIALFGFDGFVDELYEVVKKRSSLETYEVMKSMKEWAERIEKTAGSGTDCEVLLKKQRTGGFVANTCEALAAFTRLEKNLTMIGNFGLPSIFDLFEHRFKQVLGCKLISIGNPGHTNAYEFHDGKVMMTNFAPVYSISLNTILAHITKGELKNIVDKCNLIGLGYWSLTPTMPEIFDYYYTQLLSDRKNPMDLFLDLADLRKKKPEDIIKGVEQINRFKSPIRVYLSLNDKEAIELADALSNSYKKNMTFSNVVDYENFEKILQFLREYLTCDIIIIHTPKFALLSEKRKNTKISKLFAVENALTSTPKTTVAAGDTFNGGICSGILMGLEPAELLLLGNCFTSYFVRTGERGTMTNIIGFLSNYLTYLKEDHSEIIQTQ